jgi:putative ABC transport system permease protein
MFKNHLKIAWRSIRKEKFFTLIKIGGFAIGIAACLLIALFIRDELSYDKHYKNTDRIYRLVRTVDANGDLIKHVYFQPPFANALLDDYPDIENSGRMLRGEVHGTGGKELRKLGDIQSTYEKNFVFVDQNLLEVFDVPMVNGNVQNALSSPNSIVISKRKAAKYFPNEDALGKQLILDNDSENPFTIGGVMENPKANTHFDFDFLMTMTGKELWEGEQSDWWSSNYNIYVLLKPNTDVAALEKKLLGINKKYIFPAFLKNSNEAEAQSVIDNSRFFLQPISDIHLKSNDIIDNMSHGDIGFIWLFGAISGFILLLACINFINLSTAKSANRAKEVGLRKTIGAFRSNLIRQFLTESILFSIISFILGSLLAWILLPYFNSIASKSLMLPWNEWWFLPVLLISSLIIGLIAGLYPAFYLSVFKPIDVLKGSLSIGSRSGKLRSSLVVFQFTTSVVLIIGTLIIYQQMDFILNKKLGYDKDQVLIIQGTQTLGSNIQPFKNKLLELSSIKQVSISDYLPVAGTMRNGNFFFKEGKIQEDTGVDGQIWDVDHDYIETLGMKLVKGRNFSREIASDSTDAAIINQSMAEKLNLNNPVGERIAINGKVWTVIGVVKDFHYDSLKADIVPLLMEIDNSPSMITVKLNSDKIDKSVTTIMSIWRGFAPNQSFRYSFLDQEFATMYKDVNRMGSIFNSFALFAIIIASLGLFALSAFMVEQRKKEISIRLVLGAPFKSIYKLLTLDFLKLIFISIVIAIPIGWYIMSRWLEDFAYRITIGWEIFVLASAIALLVAILTISYQSIGAAFIKPLKNLRSE